MTVCESAWCRVAPASPQRAGSRQLKLTRRSGADTVIAAKLATRVAKQAFVSPSFQASE